MAQQTMPEVDQARCISCGDCIVACPTGALTLAAERIVLDEALCAYCGDCEDVCPADAIALPYEITLYAETPPSATERPGPPTDGR